MIKSLHRIKGKLEQLKVLDANLILFGASTHRYKLNPVVSKETILQFEKAHNVTLPIEYKMFLTEIGNGGAGPFYGLEPIENALFYDLDYKHQEMLLNPSMPFLLTESWNINFEASETGEQNPDKYNSELDKFDNEYFDPEYMNGVISICNYGCGVRLNLVVNGAEYGHIWTDDRTNDNGIYPSFELGNKQKVKFLDWYELWLENSINEIQRKQKAKVEETGTLITTKGKGKSFPWKFW